jgi:hypothetical protein
VAQYRKNKYGNKKTVYNGNKYDSKKEAEYAYRLDMLIKAKEVISWERQIRLNLLVNDIKVCAYLVDFIVKYPDNKVEYVDVKGYKTDIYKLKKKLVKAVLDIDIVEI